jgi:hypothetical protein
LTDEAKTRSRRPENDTKHKDGPRVPAIGVQWAKDSKVLRGQDDQRKSPTW